MPNLNKCMFMGNLTRDPEVKFTPRGTAVCAFGIAINRQWKTESGEKKEEVTFLGFEAYGPTAENLGKYFKKGHPIYVEARAKNDEWEDEETGKKMRKTKFIVESWQFLQSLPRDNADADEHAARNRSTRPAQPPRPPADPELDAAPDDIPF